MPKKVGYYSSKIPMPNGPQIQSQNSTVQKSHTLMTPKKAMPAPVVKEPKQFKRAGEGKKKAVKKGINARRIPAGHF